MVSKVEDDLGPAQWNFTRTRGDTMLGTTFDVIIDGDPMDITEAVAQVRVARNHESELVLDLDATETGSEVLVGDGVELDVEPGRYYWDLQVNGLTVVGGAFNVLPDVSEVGS